MVNTTDFGAVGMLPEKPSGFRTGFEFCLIIMRAELKDFLDHIEQKTKVRPIIYSGLVFYRDYLKGHFDDYPLWIAHYYQAELKAGAKTRWFFWQHSDKARITGINHVVDFNAFNGDSTAFERLRIPKIQIGRAHV